MKVLAALSGGVDSSCALKMVMDRGDTAIGVTLSLWDYTQPAKFGSCCASRDVMDARRVCDSWNIPFYVLDASPEFKSKVVNNFMNEYEKLRTPSPCIRCNSFVKFQRLAETARELGAEKIVTGHYAQSRIVDGKKVLAKGADLQKDQSYFLFGLPRDIIELLDMPLGKFTKPEVRALAREWKIVVAEKPDSQELCFLGTDKPADFIKKHGTPGYKQNVEIFDAVTGKKTGDHEQGAFFTVGQRRGTVLASGERQYVVKIEPGRVFMGPESLLYSPYVKLRDCVWHLDPSGRKLTVKLRSRHDGTPVDSLEMLGDEVKILMTEPQRAITPGQAAVLYEDDVVVGGGWIE